MVKERYDRRAFSHPTRTGQLTLAQLSYPLQEHDL
jgi:hypothetical protein